MGNTTEEIIWEGSQSQVLNFGFFALLLIAVIVITVLSFMFFPPLLFLNAILLVFIFYKWLFIRSHKYKVTNERIFYTTGILSKKTDTLELYRVKDIDLTEPFIFRMFKLGIIEIDSADESSPRFYLKAVPNPKELMDKIRTHVEKRRDLKRVRGVDFLDDHGSGDVS